MAAKNTAASRYEVMVEGQTAFVSYREAEGGTLRLTYAEVPRALRGRGVGSRLAQAVLDAIRAEGRKVVPQCSFIAFYVAQHPEYHDMVARDDR